MVCDLVPVAGDGRRMRIGLLGGSFNPPHAGHLGIALRALHALQLDQVWLLVSPGNPLKIGRDMAPFSERLQLASELSDNPRILATAIEKRLGTRYAVDTVRQLRRRFPRVHFVWLMGTDVFAELPRWRSWKTFVHLLPIAVVPRPGSVASALHGASASFLRRFRLPPSRVVTLADQVPPAWAFLPGRQNDISATRLRLARGRAF
ncbi:MAG: nicotinate-nucleotide adenylyltransferase [Acetobacter sp.]|jgi:nicotinate-nucleotide adenylyltransferase